MLPLSPLIPVKKLLLIFLLFQPALLFSQNKAGVDSLENLLKAEPGDVERVEILSQLSGYYRRSDHEKAMDASQEALAISEKVSYPRGIIISKFNIAIVLQDEGKYKEALEQFLDALKRSDALQDKKGEQVGDSLVIQINNSIANNYCLQERREEGLVYFRKALEMARKNGLKKFEAVILGNIGNVYYYKSYDFSKDVWDTAGLNTALNYYSEAIKLHQASGDTERMISPMTNFALVLIQVEKINEALDTLMRLKAICERRGDISNLVYINSNIAQAYLNSGNMAEAFKFYDITMALADSVKDMNSIMNVHAMLSVAYAGNGNYKEAYENYMKYAVLRDSMLNVENTRSVSEMQAKYETEKKEKQLEFQSVQLKEKQILIYAASFGCLLMLLLALVIFRGYRQKKRSNEIIALQKTIVEEKNKNITDSILYASMIQGSILPEQEVFYRIFPDSFIFYRPKDIVSGDFYWLSEKNENILLAVADCTGHGVPGAMMSMVGSSLLHQIVNEKTINNPSEVLAELDKQINRSLKQKGTDGENREGMDICFIDINRKNNLLKFAGANRSLYFLRDGKLEEMEGSRYPVGSVIEKPKIFSLKEIQLKKGDCIYLTTDGMADQFGEKTNKKFMTRRFKEALLAIHDQAMQRQKTELSRIIDDWRGNYEQIDDICVVGIRV